MARHKKDVLVAFVAAVLGSACQAIVPLIARQIFEDAFLFSDTVRENIAYGRPTPPMRRSRPPVRR